MKRSTLLLLAVCSAFSLGTSAAAQTDDTSAAMTNCLKAWGKHPFGENPKFRTMPVAVKVFGIGNPTIDSANTGDPELVLIKPGVNVMGGTTIDLRNPNGWYCFVTNVNVMGKVKIKAHCTAHLAQSHDGVTVMGADSQNKSVTVMGKTEVQLQGCAPKDDTNQAERANLSPTLQTMTISPQFRC